MTKKAAEMQAQTEAGKRIVYLDGWRGLAVLFVLLDHFSRGMFGWAGDLGVELFFVLSGTLMAKILFVRQIPPKPFVIHRLSRVYPALIVFSTTMFAMSILIIFAGLPRAMAVPLEEYVYSLVFLSNYYQVISGNYSVIGHLWSLSVEAHTYMILLAIALIVDRRLRAGIIATALLSIAAMLNGLYLDAAGEASHAVYWRTDVRIASILLAATLLLALRNHRLPVWVSPVLLSSGVLIFALTPDAVRFTLGTFCLAAAVSSLPTAAIALKSFLSTRPLELIGLYSYSIYLWQQPFYKFAERAPAWMTPIALTGVAFMAYISFHLVENPARSYINRRMSQY